MADGISGIASDIGEALHKEIRTSLKAASQQVRGSNPQQKQPDPQQIQQMQQADDVMKDSEISDIRGQLHGMMAQNDTTAQKKAPPSQFFEAQRIGVPKPPPQQQQSTGPAIPEKKKMPPLPTSGKKMGLTENLSTDKVRTGSHETPKDLG